MPNEELLTSGGLAVASALLAGVGWTRRQESDKTLLLWMSFGMLMAAAVSVATINSQGIRWQWILAALPTLMLTSHGAFLYYVRSKVLPRATPANEAQMRAIVREGSEGPHEEFGYAQLLEVGERYFSAQALLLRYGVPAVMLLGISLTISNALTRAVMHDGYFASNCGTTASEVCDVLKVFVEKEPRPRIEAASVPFLPKESVAGAAYGLMGAYAYVLLYLGKRSFRLDITPGAATWCTVTMAVGPVLGGFLGLVIKAKLPTQGAGLPSVETGTELPSVAALFLAGFAPRFIVESLEEAGRRVFTDRSINNLSSRTLPLMSVRGVSRNSQDRLEEEGIDDAMQLAMADPYRLLRNTSFDKRQILRWMDAAILMVHLPEAFSALERRGITGAMSLTSYARDSNQEVLQGLASDAHLDPVVLKAVAKQLASDRQQKLIRILYMLDDGYDSRAPNGANLPPVTPD